MTDPQAGRAEEELARQVDNTIPSSGFHKRPVVGLGGSAGSIPALTSFLEHMPLDTGLSFVVVMHLSPEHESTLAELLQRSTKMKVVQVSGALKIEPDTVYVIPPRAALRMRDGTIESEPITPGSGRTRHVAVDVFFRTLADTHGPHAAAIVFSGADGDGAIGIKRIKERGGLTVAQDPEEAEHAGMPRSAIGTGMVDWVLRAAEMPKRVLEYFQLESHLKLPPEEGPQPAQPARAPTSADEASLRDVLTFLRTRTGRDFSYYKRATIVRRIARRMQVNGTHDLQEYMACLRTRPGEAGALLQDLLITVTNFFRDPECFAALDREIPAMLAGKGPGDTVRVWVTACATGEEAYSIAMLLAEHTRGMDAPPVIQIFATDLDDQAVQTAREGVYPEVIEADVSEERLKRFFVKEHRGYRVRRELREMVLFAMHDVLKDSPFSRLDLVSCRNLLIYLNREAQSRVLDTFHFALLPGGRLFLGSSESVEDGSTLFNVVDKKHRLYQQRPMPRAGLPVPNGPGTLALALEAQGAAREGPVIAGNAFRTNVHAPAPSPEPRSASWAELHLKLVEMLAPPSILIDSEYDIVHLSPSAGRFLQIAGGEPTRNLLRSVNPSLRIELRAALYQAAQSQQLAEVHGVPVEIGGEHVALTIRVLPAKDMGADLYLVMLQAVAAESEKPAPQPLRAEDDPVARHLDRELERLKAHLRDTVEQYEASTEELKASNEELQAMNEELRSATEELETSREELQSINEELTTVNHELKNKVDELGHANSDMHNLMDATAIATVFLDRELRITRFTPSAVSLFNLIPTDVGRPLTDLKTQLQYPELGGDASRVLEKLVPIEREVGQADGSWYLARLLPYRTIEDRIAGVVLSFINITERKQAEEMRLWLSAVVTASSDAIISFSLDGTVLSWNHGAERIFGHTASEAIGSPVQILSPLDPTEQDMLLAKIASAQPVDNYETVRRRKDGSELHVSITISPIRDESGKVMAGTAIVRDITAAKLAEAALRESEERLRLVIENATEFAIFSLDLERRVTVWNSGAQRLLGYANDEIVGKPADIIFTPEDRDAGAPERETRTALAEGRASDDRFHVRKDGSRFWASGAAMVMRDGNGEAVGFVKILRDQTHSRESREALERSQGELLRVLAENERARADLQAADVAKDRYLAVLSHELRNPLASIDSAAELVGSQGVSAQDAKEAAAIVARQAQNMKMLLDDLLDISRLKLGKLELRRERVLLSSIVASALESTRPALQEAGHSLTVDLEANDIELEGDPLRLGQVVSNLLSNSIRYTPRGGKITLRGRLDGDALVLTVKDNGVGMEPQRIADMFEMFTQGDPASQRANGLGIGLALVKSIVELHGGQVSAQSQGPGRGSEFTLRLPGARATRARAPVASPAPAQTAAPAKKRRGLVLVADDNVDAGWGVAKLLEIAGFETLNVRSGEEALSAMEQHKPDAAVLDIGMPDIDGHEVARRVRAAPWGKAMVLIAATGWGQEGDERQSVAAGFDAHMTKPVDVRKLASVIDERIASRKR